MQDFNDNLDPIQELPNEMFASILSFLPPSSIAHSSAASRLWRRTILSNPTLHQEIDLTSMLANLPILYHYSRLSSLALNQVVKVSLNLTSFYNEFSQNLEQENRTFSASDVLLSMMQNSKETMRELNLSLDQLEEEELLKGEMVPFLVRLLQGLDPFNALQVSVTAPIGFALDCGDDNQTSKAFIVRNSLQTTYEMHGLSKAVDLMDAAQNFTQKDSYRELDFGQLEDSLNREQSLALLEQLKSSTLTMKRLDLGVFSLESAVELWEFALQFRNLECLRVYLRAWGREEANRERIQVSKATPPAAGLRELDLRLNDLHVDWESITRWAGRKLEVLRLDVDSIPRNENPLFSSRSYTSIILSTQKTLKRVELFETGREVAGNDPGVQAPSFSSFNLPNLKVLHLDIFGSTLKFFANLRMPQLRTLGILELRSTSRDIFEVLVNFLRGQSATLKNLDLRIHPSLDSELPEPFKFELLEELGVWRSNDSFIEWMSHNQYPKLIFIPQPQWKEMDLYDKFKPNAPHLKFSEDSS